MQFHAERHRFNPQPTRLFLAVQLSVLDVSLILSRDFPTGPFNNPWRRTKLELKASHRQKKPLETHFSI